MYRLVGAMLPSVVGVAVQAAVRGVPVEYPAGDKRLKGYLACDAAADRASRERLKPALRQTHPAR